jgi:hypothetical protein
MQPWIDGEVFTLRRDASEQRPTGFTGAGDDNDLRGVTLAVRSRRVQGPATLDARLGASMQRLRHAGGSGRPRDLALAQFAFGMRQQSDRNFATQRLSIAAAYGRSPDSLTFAQRTFTRGLATLAIAVGGAPGVVRGEGTYGLVSRAASTFERFTVGGAAPSYFDDATLGQWVAMPALPFGIVRGRRYASYRVAIGDEALSPFFWSGAAGESIRDWMRVVGVDAHVAVPPIPVIRLPSADIRAGVGYSLDQPWRKRTRGYVALRYRP